jgi:1,2-diacylglycerol 3-beta-glucosyltransferase
MNEAPADMVLETVFFALGAIVFPFLAHALFLALVSFLPGRKGASSEPSKTHHFTLIVPAHDEEHLLARTLTSLQALDYPSDLVRIVVIADNCTDQTVNIARSAGVVCLERDAPGESGKGRALAWAFARLPPGDSADAFVIVDADTLVARDLLSVFAGHLDVGAQAIQGYYDVLSPERSPMASFTFAGFAVSRNLNYLGRTRLGWGSNLVGNGMCFSRAVVNRFGWGAYSISEDLEYQLELFLQDVRVVFAPGARVWGEIPGGVRAYHAQRSRWDVGKYKLRNRYVPRLLAKAIRGRDIGALNAALELISPPYALLGGMILGTSALYVVIGADSISANHLLWGSMSAAFLAYVLAGLRAAQAPARVYLNLAYAPAFLAWRILIALSSPFRSGTEWTPSER